MTVHIQRVVHQSWKIRKGWRDFWYDIQKERLSLQTVVSDTPKEETNFRNEL